MNLDSLCFLVKSFFGNTIWDQFFLEDVNQFSWKLYFLSSFVFGWCRDFNFSFSLELTCSVLLYSQCREKKTSLEDVSRLKWTGLFTWEYLCTNISGSSRWDSSRLCVPWHLATTMQCIYLIMEQIIRCTSPGCTFEQIFWICWFATEKWVSQRYHSPTSNEDRGSRILEALRCPHPSFLLILLTA